VLVVLLLVVLLSLQCAAGTYTQKAYGSKTAASCVNYTTVDWISDSTAYAKSKGVTNLAFNLNLCVQYIKAKTNATNTTLIVRNLNNSLCNYGPYNVQFCNWCVQLRQQRWQCCVEITGDAYVAAGAAAAANVSGGYTAGVLLQPSPELLAAACLQQS
jgi:hypothetical protein